MCIKNSTLGCCSDSTSPNLVALAMPQYWASDNFCAVSGLLWQHLVICTSIDPQHGYTLWRPTKLRHIFGSDLRVELLRFNWSNNSTKPLALTSLHTICIGKPVTKSHYWHMSCFFNTSPNFDYRASFSDHLVPRRISWLSATLTGNPETLGIDTAFLSSIICLASWFCSVYRLSDAWFFSPA